MAARVGPRATFELRVVTSDDWQAWRVIRLEALAEAPYAFGSTLAEWENAPEERWRARLGLEGSHNLVAYAGGSPVGMATGVPGEVPGTTQLISMYVSQSARGTGVAALLLDTVEGWARDQGASVLCLDVRAENSAARRAYERHGYVVMGAVERSSPDEPPELRMRKTLS